MATLKHAPPKTPVQIACDRIARELASRSLTPARVVAVMRLPHGVSAEDATRFVSLVAARKHEMLDGTSPLWRSLSASLGLTLSDICPGHSAWVSSVLPMPRRARERDPIAAAAEAATRALSARGLTEAQLAGATGEDVRSVRKLLDLPLVVSRHWPAIARALGVSLVHLATEGGASRQIAEQWALRQPVMSDDAVRRQAALPQPPKPPPLPPPPASADRCAEADRARDAAIAEALERAARAELQVEELRSELHALIARLKGAL